MERQADWRQEKAQALARARVVVIKVGSAVLTDAQGLSTPVLESLARQMAALRTAPDGHERRLVLVSSGIDLRSYLVVEVQRPYQQQDLVGKLLHHVL